MKPFYNLAHPYARYGLATALLQAQVAAEELSDENAPEYLARAIETGLNNLRLATDDDPSATDMLRFRPITFEQLKQDGKLVQSAGLAAQGKYLAPSVVTTDGDAKGTYDNATAIVKDLRVPQPLDGGFTFSRSFAPTTAKINNGRSSQSPPKGTLFEAACSAITTLTPIKPSSWVDGRNTVIIPDLPLDELRDFVELFENMMRTQLDGNLYEAKLVKHPAATPAKQTTSRKKKIEPVAPKSEFKRPRLFNGNYPFAPRQAAFGAAGLLAAIGRWALAVDETEWAKRVLESIAGTAERLGRPLYIISYDNISQVQFSHHIVNLSMAGALSHIIDGLIRDTLIFSEIEGGGRRYDVPAYKLFYLMASRFLQQFTLPAFRDFLATRAEYPSITKPLFEVYFMESRKIDRDIVVSARELGQWLNRTAFIVADKGIEPKTPDREAKVQKEKAKILIEFESAAMSAKTPQDMLHRISTRAGRLLGQDAPSKATRFMDAAASGEINLQEAQHLLIAYLRLRAEKPERLELKEENGSLTITPTMSLTAIYKEAEEGGYIGYITELPGANTQGETLEEVRENLIEAAQMILEANREEAEKRLANSEKIIRERMTLRAA
jgi:predicted RNase H-like HicB family nuclease